MSLPTLEVLFAPSVVGANAGTRLILDDVNAGLLDTGTLGDGAFFYDITTFVRSFSTSRGRRRALDRFSTGTATITLDNRDRRFDPTNSASPYYNSSISQSGVVPAIPVIVRATWAGTTYSVFRGFIDSWSFAYNGGTVGDATATIVCSDAFKALSNVIGGLPNATQVTSSGSTTVNVGVSTVGTSTASTSTAGGFVVVTTTSSQNVAVSLGTETTPTIGTAGDLSGTRINSILDAAGWPVDLRTIDAGITRLEVQNATQTVLAMLQEVEATEAGALYVEADGSVVFQDRYSLIADDRALTSQATYDPTDAGGKNFTSVEIDYDDQLIRNIIRITRKRTTNAGGDENLGTTVMASNIESQSLYGARTLDLELPIPSTYSSDTNYGQDQIAGLALMLASIYANPEFRPASLSFIAQANEELLYPEVLGRRIFDRVTVKFAVPGGGSAIQRDCFIEQINHDVTPDRWQTTFGLASATFYTDFMVLDSSTHGLLDTDRLAY